MIIWTPPIFGIKADFDTPSFIHLDISTIFYFEPISVLHIWKLHDLYISVVWYPQIAALCNLGDIYTFLGNMDFHQISVASNIF